MRQLNDSMPSRSTGFTLVEVLITVFVTGIGLLTVAGLQAAAKKINYEATQRTVAAALAQDMVERMRSSVNPNALSSVNETSKTNYVTSDATALTLDTSCVSDTATCSLATIASNDVSQWGAKLAGSGTSEGGGLVSPTGCITKSGTGSNAKYRVSIAWRGMSTADQVTDATSPQYDTCGNAKTDRYADVPGASNVKMRHVLFIEFI